MRWVDQSSGSTYVDGSSETTFRCATTGPVSPAPAESVEVNANEAPAAPTPKSRSSAMWGAPAPSAAAGATAIVASITADSDLALTP